MCSTTNFKKFANDVQPTEVIIKIVATEHLFQICSWRPFCSGEENDAKTGGKYSKKEMGRMRMKGRVGKTCGDP